jgi:phosphoglycolate phosphatase-like HAD superfamily hydrolase
MNKVLVFDMDGTIANLYGVEGWLDDLRNFNPKPYIEAKPLVDMDILNSMLAILKTRGWIIAVTSWLAKESNKDYDKEVRKAKKEWLENNGFNYDTLHLVKYGTRKKNCTRNLGGFQVLVDDNKEVRKSWNGRTIDAKNNNIIQEIAKIINDDF